MFRLYGFDVDHDGQSGDFSGLADAYRDLTCTGCNLIIYGQSVPEPTKLGLLAMGVWPCFADETNKSETATQTNGPEISL